MDVWKTKDCVPLLHRFLDSISSLASFHSPSSCEISGTRKVTARSERAWSSNVNPSLCFPGSHDLCPRYHKVPWEAMCTLHAKMTSGAQPLIHPPSVEMGCKVCPGLPITEWHDDSEHIKALFFVAGSTWAWRGKLSLDLPLSAPLHLPVFRGQWIGRGQNLLRAQTGTGWESWGCSAWKRRLQSDLIAACQYLRAGYKKEGDRLFSRVCYDRTRGNNSN